MLITSKGTISNLFTYDLYLTSITDLSVGAPLVKPTATPSNYVYSQVSHDYRMYRMIVACIARLSHVSHGYRKERTIKFIALNARLFRKSARQFAKRTNTPMSIKETFLKSKSY